MKPIQTRRKAMGLAVGMTLGLLTWASLGPLSTAPVAAGQSLQDMGIPAVKRPVVVELFTSQGCYSCPPADELLGELAEVEGLLPLSFHVDYWDYIGWKDVFASPDHSNRQRHYARELSLRYVYTPQMVIDGRFDVAGSRDRQVLAAIEKAANSQQVVPIDIDMERGLVKIPEGQAPADDATVWLVMYDKAQTTEIKKGENAGKTLTYHNVVRDYRKLAVWDGGALELPLDLASAAERDGCAVIVQQGHHGAIIGAAVVDLPGES